jgi:C4-dicarboxylate-specific signal transduction histidine kinase
MLAKQTPLSVAFRPQQDEPEPALTAMGSIPLAQVLISLVINAKADITQASMRPVTDRAPVGSEAASVPAIDVSVTTAPSTVTLVIAHAGLGMSDAEQARVLAPLDPSENIHHPRSSLHAVRAQVEHAGGSLHISSKPDVGTTVTITLPRQEMP